MILGQYVWKMFIYPKQQLYRDMINVTITLIYLTLVCVGIYAIRLGW
jgi:hypothetical protein